MQRSWSMAAVLSKPLATAFWLSFPAPLRAIEYALLAINETSDFAGAYMFLAASEVGLGSLETAVAVLEKARHIAPGFIQNRLDGGMPFRNPEHLKRFTTFLRVAAGVEDPSAADVLR